VLGDKQMPAFRVLLGSVPGRGRAAHFARRLLFPGTRSSFLRFTGQSVEVGDCLGETFPKVMDLPGGFQFQRHSSLSITDEIRDVPPVAHTRFHIPENPLDVRVFDELWGHSERKANIILAGFGRSAAFGVP
jgi:hypothetical protein